MKSIDGKKMKELMERSHATPIDVAAQSTFRKGHIKGAINIPHNDKAFVDTVQHKFAQKNEEIVLCGQSTLATQLDRLANELERAGYKNIYQYKANPSEWRSSGLNVQSTARSS